MADTAPKSKQWGTVLMWFVFVLFAVWIGLATAKPTPPPAPTPAPRELDPMTKASKKELIRFLPRTEYNLAKLAEGTGQFNTPVRADVIHFSWEAHVDGDGNVWFLINQKFPPYLMETIREFSVRNENWHIMHDGPHQFRTEISVPNGWLTAHMDRETSIADAVEAFADELGGYGVHMETAKYFPLVSPEAETAALANPPQLPLRF